MLSANRPFQKQAEFVGESDNECNVTYADRVVNIMWQDAHTSRIALAPRHSTPSIQFPHIAFATALGGDGVRWLSLPSIRFRSHGDGSLLADRAEMQAEDLIGRQVRQRWFVAHDAMSLYLTEHDGKTRNTDGRKSECRS